MSATALPVDAHYLDVREIDEWRAGHIEDAQHIPLAELPFRLHEIPRDRRVVCVCRVGARSAQATVFLARHGIQAMNLDGGMEAWRAARHPMVSDTGLPATVA